MTTNLLTQTTGNVTFTHGSLRKPLTRLLMAGLLTYTAHVSAQSIAAEHRETFDTTADGLVPSSWKADATDPAGPLAQWQVTTATASPSPPKILTIERIQDTSRGVFNLLWSKQIKFKHGEVEVRVRANSGDIDQGGGLIWRVKDANNYYVARYNPLENNFRLYYVKDGQRVQLASAERLSVPKGAWFHLRISHHGRRIQGWFNDTHAWEVTDMQLPGEGGVGVWTKADAASSFDDFVVRRATKTTAHSTTP